MGFLFFGKKKKQADNPVEHMNKIADNLKTSFIRVKADIKVVRDWLSFFKTQAEDHEQRFKNIESRVEELSEVIAYLADKDQNNTQPTPKTPQATREPQYYDYEEKITPPQKQKTILDNLTETQQALFLRIGAFQRESGQEWTPLKTLAQDIYPGKSYDRVRSTISEYVGLLVDVGLIKKMRKGKQTYVSVTEQGKTYFSKNNTKLPKKAVSKSK
jgi:hypothetical protein